MLPCLLPQKVHVIDGGKARRGAWDQRESKRLNNQVQLCGFCLEPVQREPWGQLGMGIKDKPMLRYHNDTFICSDEGPYQKHINHL